MTGLVLALFAGRNATTTNRGPYQEQMRRAVNWFLEGQNKNGAYSILANTEHALATWGIAEVTLVERTPRLCESLDRGIRFLIKQQNKDGGWNDSSRGNPTSVLGTYWAVKAIKTADRSWVLSPESRALCAIAVAKAKGWIEVALTPEATLAAQSGAAQTFPASVAAQTEAAILIRGALRSRRKRGEAAPPIDLAIRKRFAAVSIQSREGLPVDPLRFYVASSAARRSNRAAWAKAWRPYFAQVAGARRGDGKFAGSWNPIGVGRDQRTRMLTTALIALGLEVDPGTQRGRRGGKKRRR